MIFGGVLSYFTCFGWLPLFLMGLLGFLLCWLLSKLFGKGHSGDLTSEGEGALRAEADDLRARIRALEGKLSDSDGEVSTLKSQLAAAGTGAAVVAGASALAGDADDDTYALEWRNRYLAARVKYLEGRLAEAPKSAPKKKAAPKKTAKKAPAKKAPAKKAPAKKAAAKPKVLYTDGPTDGAPDDLKQIKGIGPKFEKDLNSKGIYYFRQIANWKAADVKMVEGVIDSIPGRIKRDEWVPQAKGLAKGGAKKSAAKKAPAKKAAAKKAPAKKAANPNQKYYDGVMKFHKSAKKGTIDAIVKYCGISLRSRDAALVACSDPSEMETVAKNFGVKKLGLNKAAAEKAAADTCAEMKSVRQKNRAVFYYLMAKRAKKLSVFE